MLAGILTGIPRGPAGPGGPASPWQPENSQRQRSTVICMCLTTPTIARPLCVFRYSTHPQPWFPVFSIQSLDARGALSMQTQRAQWGLNSLQFIDMFIWCNTHIPSALGSLVSLGVRLIPVILEYHRCPLKAAIISTNNNNMDVKKAALCVICTHFFTFGSSESFPSTLARRTW